MTQLSYDNTFEGLLTTVFEIYEFKYSNPKISKKDDLQHNLFAEKIEIITDISKSDRVIKKLNAQIGSDGVRCIIYAFLSEKTGVEDVIFDVINYAVQNPTINIMKDFANEKTQAIWVACYAQPRQLACKQFI